MTSRIQREFLSDMTGGVNLRADPFLLAENELDGICNMEVDPRGGVFMRRGWQRWNTEDVTEDAWDARSVGLFRPPGQSAIVLVCNNDTILASTDGTFTDLGVTANAAGVGAAFVSWNENLYVACGRMNPAVKWDGINAPTTLTAAGNTMWNNDPTTPIGGVMPQADLAVAHNGYLFVANTREDGVNYPNRVRWSHINNPEDWAEQDFHDLTTFGRITALVPYGDHLLIFGESQVWALYGYDLSSWQFSIVSSTVGTPSPRCVAASETHVYFYSHPDGVFSYNAQTLDEVSTPLRPIFQDGRFNPGAVDEVALGWLNRRLWFCAPYSEVGGLTTNFVLDPSIGAWTAFVGGDLEAVGPFVEDHTAATPRFFALSRSTPDVMLVDREGGWVDEHGGEDLPFQSWFVTRWVSGPTPDGKKSWKRPSFVTRRLEADYNLRYEVFHNYDSNDVKRTSWVPVGAAGDVAVYGDGSEYGDPDLEYGADPLGAAVERGSGLGSAQAVQLKVENSTPGTPWAINGINFKYVVRRYR